MKEKQVMRQK